MHKRKLSSFISPLYVTGRKSETIIPLLRAYFKSLLVIWNLWRSLRSCILYMLKDPYQQLWKPANPRVYGRPRAGRCRLPSTSCQGGQARASSSLKERLLCYLVALCYRLPVITSKLCFISWKLPLKILHLLLLGICLDVPLAFDSHTKAHCSALFSH